MVGKIFLKLIDDDDMVPHFIKGPCPLMEFVDGKIRCGVVLAEAEVEMEPKTAEALGIGMGCCADDPCEYRDTEK